MLDSIPEREQCNQILYAGCGIGLHAIDIALERPEDRHVVGIDKNKDLYEIAAHNMSCKSAMNVEFIHTGLASFACDESAFETMIIGNGEMLPFEREKIFETAYRLLVNDGSVNGRDFAYIERSRREKISAPYWLDLMSISEYTKMLVGIGYSRVSMEPASQLSNDEIMIPPELNISVGYPMEEVVVVAYK